MSVWYNAIDFLSKKFAIISFIIDYFFAPSEVHLILTESLKLKICSVYDS